MFNIIPLILILISLVVICTIVIKKFPILANLDIDSIQSEREAKFKEQIISNRLKRNYFRYYNQALKLIRPLMEGGANFFKWGYHKLLEFRDNYNKEQVVIEDGDVTLERLFAEIEALQKGEDGEEIEKKLIKAISLDSKNVKAFRMLGEVYFGRKDFNEAKQTWEHALRLAEKELEVIEQNKESGKEVAPEEALQASRVLSELYFDLAMVSIKIENIGDSLENIKKALKIEPNNPRYLDTMLEISIIKKDKHLAEKTYMKLEKVNPENGKLEEIKRQIEELN
ncbi:MAG: hypothetical protein Q7T50_05970 [Candidatus Magasanikbacteria bacterium]|nr:hypothetical protein [Candidatus Magasanikbacteria bacterium]